MKAIITDLDRTLLHTDKSVSEHTIAVLKKCRDQLVGDYDKCQTEEEIIEMIKTGK